MLNEGVIYNDTAVVVKSEIIKQLRNQTRTTPKELEQSVFTALTGAEQKDVDWEFDDNQAGYFLWIKSFDDLLKELVADGYVLVEKGDGGQELTAAEVDTDFSASQTAYPGRSW